MYVCTMSKLDQIVMRIVVADIKRHIRDGCLPDEAVSRATPGAWRWYRGEVICVLLDEIAAQDLGHRTGLAL